MADAVVGDDGSGEDPTVIELEELYAQWVGKPAAVFVPSGVMANQLALRLLTTPGDVVVAGALQHVVSFELGAAAKNAGVQFRTVDDTTGHLDPEAVRAAMDAEAHHQPAVGLLALENTHMASGGVPSTAAQLRQLADLAHGLPVHLDGARLFNASIALGCSGAELAASSTTVVSCLSKGLCAPVGSLLAGPLDVMAASRDERKRLGGGMRQAGVIAAAGLVALRTMVERLADDHARAQRLAVAVAETVAPDYDPATCRTNIVAFDHPDVDTLVERLGALEIRIGTVAPGRARLVTHADVDDAMIDATIDALSSI
jgi:threonine aldolase